jgi:hypothetical protein
MCLFDHGPTDTRLPGEAWAEGAVVNICLTIVDWEADPLAPAMFNGTAIERGQHEGRHPLETGRRGVFAMGDVRSGSVKRVAAAVGEGAQVVPELRSFRTQTE